MTIYLFKASKLKIDKPMNMYMYVCMYVCMYVYIGIVMYTYTTAIPRVLVYWVVQRLYEGQYHQADRVEITARSPKHVCARKRKPLQQIWESESRMPS